MLNKSGVSLICDLHGKGKMGKRVGHYSSRSIVIYIRNMLSNYSAVRNAGKAHVKEKQKCFLLDEKGASFTFIIFSSDSIKVGKCCAKFYGKKCHALLKFRQKENPHKKLIS